MLKFSGRESVIVTFILCLADANLPFKNKKLFLAIVTVVLDHSPMFSNNCICRNQREGALSSTNDWYIFSENHVSCLSF